MAQQAHDVRMTSDRRHVSAVGGGGAGGGLFEIRKRFKTMYPYVLDVLQCFHLVCITETHSAFVPFTKTVLITV